MTEDEAKMRQCCGPEGCGVFNDSPYNARWCVASACMAWREVAGSGRWVSPMGPKALEEALRPEDVDAKFVRDGYCGLAGVPQ